MPAILLLSASLMMNACSGLKTYSSDLDKNLRITTEADSGSIFSNVRTAVDIHTVNPDCTTEYAGTVKLGNEYVDIGIPAGRSSYLVFIFEKSGFLSGESSTTFNTLIRPREGYKYTASASYKEDIYNVVLNETNSVYSRNREIETKGLYACRPL